MRKTDKITHWKQFISKIRPKKDALLKNIDCYDNSVLVTGCQRSGTTILSRIIAQSEGMTNYFRDIDDELEAALILSGYKQLPPTGRYCFQTTYLNENYYEYFNIGESHKIIWVLRNPYSVICSMLHNWRNYALNEDRKSVV